MPEYRITTDQLREGVFIKLDQKWFEHPFAFSSFKITKTEQINTLRELGITTMTCVPEKSEVLPLSPQLGRQNAQPVGNADKESDETKKLWEMKKERIERLKARRAKDEHCECEFRKSVAEVKNVIKEIENGSQEAFEASDRLMQGIADSLMPEKESAVQLMNTKFGKENIFFHSLNVAVLSMMLGREFGLESGKMRLLGLAAMFHDLGKSRIPKSILHKGTALTKAEQDFYRLHPKYGVEMLSKLRDIPPEVLQAILQHHERNDGQGFPDGLPGRRISNLAKIVSIVNTYDNHCNKFNPEESLTPHEALAYMFSAQKHYFDQEILALFIQCLGVYPPGTIVKLSNGSTGMVISVNPRNPLHPSLLMYNPEVPKKEALIFNMAEETGFRIEESIKPSLLEPEVFDYLSPRTRVTYYVAEGDSPEGAAGKSNL
jgi:putative nucleotidyltransferase with HDIG domain